MPKKETPAPKPSETTRKPARKPKDAPLIPPSFGIGSSMEIGVPIQDQVAHHEKMTADRSPLEGLFVKSPAEYGAPVDGRFAPGDMRPNIGASSYTPRYKVYQSDWNAVAQIRPILHRAAEATGWPEDYLTAQAIAESSGGQRVDTNSAGAMGIFQIRPKHVEKRFSQHNDNPDTNAVHAAQMNQWILANKGHGDTLATLAKYNKGPYSGVESNQYALNIMDIVKQIRAQRAANDAVQMLAKSGAMKTPPKVGLPIGSKNIANRK